MTGDRATDADLWRSLLGTLQDVAATTLPGRQLDTIVQLQGLARYAAERPPDPTDRRTDELARSLMLPGPAGRQEVLAAASDALVRSVGGDTEHRSRAARVRAVLLQHLDEEISSTEPLLDTFSGHPATDVSASDLVVPATEQAALARWFAGRIDGLLGLQPATVISGGHSRRMLRVTLDTVAGSQHLVVRIEQGGMFDTDGTTEARAMVLLAEAGVPVARVRWVEPSPGPLGQPFFVMDAVAGRSSVDDVTLGAFLGALHGLHRLDPATLAPVLGPTPGPEEAVRTQIDHWLQVSRRSAGTVPLLEEAAAWLGRHLHPTGPTCVVHGDPGPGNFLHDEGNIAALTDWEFVHLGDAAEDWAYFVTVRSRRLHPPDVWQREIARVTGVQHDARTWHAWEAFNQFKGACANLTALSLFSAGVSTTPNLLAIGTAVHDRFLRRLADLVRPDLP